MGLTKKERAQRKRIERGKGHYILYVRNVEKSTRDWLRDQAAATNRTMGKYLDDLVKKEKTNGPSNQA